MNGRFELDPESGRILDQALQQARDALFHLHKEGSEPETDVKVAGRRVNWADALTEIARRSLDGDESPARRERFRINLFLNLDLDLGVMADWEDRSAVPDFLTDKLTCDGHVTPTFIANGKPVSVGRALRIVPDRARRLVLHRDAHKCRNPTGRTSIPSVSDSTTTTSGSTRPAPTERSGRGLRTTTPHPERRPDPP